MAAHRGARAWHARKQVVDRWVAGHLRLLQVAVAALGVLLLVTSAFVIFGGPDGTTRLAQVPPTPPSPSTFAPSQSAPAQLPEIVRRSSSAPPARHNTCTGSSDLGAGGAVPVHICIPAIGVNADVMQLGLNPDRTVQVPPLSQVGTAGWYKYSPAPGVVGPSIILGHIDSAQYGKGVFFDLGRLRRGDRISLTRADSRVATFRVNRLAEYPKSRFPSQTVYGNTADAAIRLITCGGQFDASSGNYLDNVVAFGTLVSLSGPAA